jgi:hypothetical protein
MVGVVSNLEGAGDGVGFRVLLPATVPAVQEVAATLNAMIRIRDTRCANLILQTSYYKPHT